MYNYFTFPCAIRGYHVYQRTWLPAIDDRIDCAWEYTNLYDRFAIKCVDPDGNIVGHLPMEISRITKFLIDRGAVVHANVTNIRYRVSPLVQGGLEIPCLVTVTTDDSLDDRIIRRYKELVSSAYEEPDDPIYRGTVGVMPDDDTPIRKSASSSGVLSLNRPSSSKSGTPSVSEKFQKKKKKQEGILQFCKPTARYENPDEDDMPRAAGIKKRPSICIPSDESD